MQRVDELQVALFRRVRQGLRERVVTWTHLQQRLLRAKPSAMLKQRREALDRLSARLTTGVRRQLSDRRTQLDRVRERLRLLSPDSVLARGYSVTLDAATGAVIREARTLQKGQRLRTRLQAGEVKSVVED
jgi:exodeoxyribonuclease VII large subunit